MSERVLDVVTTVRYTNRRILYFLVGRAISCMGQGTLESARFYFVLCCVLQLCTMIDTHTHEQFLQVTVGLG